MSKTKTKQSETKMVKTGYMVLNVRVPDLLPEEAKAVVRDVRRTLENCGSLNLLGEFTEVLTPEYIEVPVEVAD